MTPTQLSRWSGLSLVLGAVAFVVHIVARSLLTAGADPLTFPLEDAWVPTNVLGLAGALLVLIGLPGTFASFISREGALVVAGLSLVAVAWTFFGVFLSLYGALLLPWLAEKAPSLISAPPPAGFMVAFLSGFCAWGLGAVLLGIPFVRGRLRPRWVGYALPASALWVVVGSLVIAPTGPAENPAVNLLSNLGPVLLVATLGYLGARAWRDSPAAPAMNRESSSRAPSRSRAPASGAAT